MKSFMDEDWTGLTHQQIYSQIRSELEEQQCRKKGHEWVPAYYCSVCGLDSDEALEGLTGKRRYRKKKK